MTGESKRISFSQMCAALPEGFSWGDSLTPDVFQHIEAAILQAATRDSLNNTKSRLIADLIDANEKAARAEMPHINVYACIDIIRQFDFGTTRDAPSADAAKPVGDWGCYKNDEADNIESCKWCRKSRSIAATVQPPKEDAVDAQRYRWLQQQRARVWHEIAEMPIIATSEFIDKAIAASAPKGDGND